jgi:hypothetical protein
VSTRPLADELADEAHAAWLEHDRSRQGAAGALGLPLTTFEHRLKVALLRRRGPAVTGQVGGPPIPPVARPPDGFVVRRNSGEYDESGKLRRQWVETGQGTTDGYEVPPGHTVKGESTLLDANENVLVRWVKTRETGAGETLLAQLAAAFQEYAGAAPPVMVPGELGSDDLLTVYPLPDLHLGMHAWGRETGADWDLKIAVDTAMRSVTELAGRAPPSKRAVLLGLGDYFHANDGRGVTPASGNRLDVDSRWAKVFGIGARLAVGMVDVLARHHEEVEVVFLRGNHDPDAAMSLTVALSLFYSNTPRISVYDDPRIAWYRRFGTCLLGATHGHTMDPARMAMMLAADRPRDWGETLHRHLFFGHIHRETAIEVGPVRVESFASPAAKDGWNADGGYRSGRRLTAISFHRERGEVGRSLVTVAEPPG